MSNINLISYSANANFNPREQNNSVSSLFLLDRMHTSYAELFALTKDFVNKKHVDSKWVDFYSGGVGTTLQQLMAGHSEYDAYQAITARRESYLFEAKLQSSAVGIASAMGYSAFRGKNPQLRLTITPLVDQEVQAFSIIGTIGEFDIISLDNVSIKYGEQVEINVVLGKLMEQSITIDGAKTHFFRFDAESVSEDIQLILNSNVVPYSRDILDLLKDYFVILSNSVGGVDIFYLNRYPPNGWLSQTRYTYYDYIKPNYARREYVTYKVGDHCINPLDDSLTPIFYKCIIGGMTNITTIEWNEDYGSIIQDGDLQWENVGRKEAPRYFKSITPGISESGMSEPIWPIALGQIIKENDIDWICVDEFGVSKYTYDTGSIITLRYIESDNVSYVEKDLKLTIGHISIVTTSSLTSDKEEIESIQINAPLYHETQKLVRGREDYRKLFKQLAPGIIDVNGFDVSPAVVELTYIKDHTTKIWEYNLLVEKGDLYMPTKTNNYIYKALNGGRTANSTSGYSGTKEPEWSTELEGITKDGEIIWITEELNLVVPVPYWKAMEPFRLKTYVQPNISNGYMYRMSGVSKEPEWITKIGETIKDNEITWECVDTIFLNGYDTTFYETEQLYKEGDFVEPVNTNGYFYRCLAPGISGETEPDWPLIICDTVIDGTTLWECYDLLDSPLYEKNVIKDLLPFYRPYGVEPNLVSDPLLINVTFDLHLTLNTIIDILTIKNDIDTLLKKYQRILGINVEASDLEYLIEDNIEYIHIARITLYDNDKVKTWEPGLKIKAGDVVKPTEPNGFWYVCKLVTLGSSSYTQWEDRGYTSIKEPMWSSNIGDRIEEDYLVWEMRPRSEFPISPNVWTPNTIKLLDSGIAPTDANLPLFAKLVEVKFEEPKWATVTGKSVKDNRLFWVAVDPIKTLVPLAWNEYYIFTRNIFISYR